jgi:hypothetical protein
VPANQVYSDGTVIFSFEDFGSFALLQSSIHEAWLVLYSSSIRTDIRYTPSDCFDTFPFPIGCEEVAKSGDAYYSVRRQIMLARQEGLTKTYNRFHTPNETSADIQKLRQLHVEMDNAVAAAYGWNDLDLGHGFHETKQGVRYTISEPARREVLARLLKLNHERYAEEVKQGLHEKKKPKGSATRGKKSTKSSAPGNTLFDSE